MQQKHTSHRSKVKQLPRLHEIPKCALQRQKLSKEEKISTFTFLKITLVIKLKIGMILQVYKHF